MPSFAIYYLVSMSVYIAQAGKVVQEKGKRKLRKVVTGDPDKRVRDHMKEGPQVRPLIIVKQADSVKSLITRFLTH